jgi:hydrogenase assembly chaperone HypC/HupF
MCVILPCRVCGLDGEQAEIELPDGGRARVSAALAPLVAVGSYVLVDRGVILKIIDAAEAATILELYREMDQLLQAEETLG